MDAFLISIVLPAYNESGNIQPVYEALARVFSVELKDCRYEIIFVNDGSSDDTVERVRAISAEDEGVKLISLSRNFGHQAALSAGLERATGQAVITMDCDMQHPPSLIPKMVDAWIKGNKVVYARRNEQVNTMFKRVTSEWYYRLLQHTSSFDMPRNVGDFRLVDREVKDHLVRMGEHARYLRGLVAWLGFKNTVIDFDQPDRLSGGASRYTLAKMMRLAMDGMLNFSMFPLRIGFWLGLSSIVLAGICFLYIVYQHFIVGVFYQLYKWMIVIMFGLMGLQFMFMWIIGEYIGRIYSDVRRRPLYVVSETINLE